MCCTSTSRCIRHINLHTHTPRQVTTPCLSDSSGLKGPSGLKRVHRAAEFIQPQTSSRGLKGSFGPSWAPVAPRGPVTSKGLVRASQGLIWPYRLIGPDEGSSGLRDSSDTKWVYPASNLLRSLIDSLGLGAHGPLLPRGPRKDSSCLKGACSDLKGSSGIVRVRRASETPLVPQG